MRILGITGLALVALLALTLPGSAQAGRRSSHRERGVTIDSHGVRFHFGSSALYRHADWPHAREFFASNVHYRQASRYERERHKWLRQAHRHRAHGNYWGAFRAFRKADRASDRQQRHLRGLEHDRRDFERGHRSGRGRGHR